MQYLFQTPQQNQPIHQHPFVWCNGRFYNIQDFGFPVSKHGFHYGTTTFGGTGVRKCIDGKHRIFRAEDHAQRFLDHAQGFGLKVPFSAKDILNACVEISRRNMPSLKTEDLYLRMALDPFDQYLGVGSSEQTDVVILAQDLTQYLKIAEGRTGASLLLPGQQLFRRGDETVGLPFFKSAINYGLGNMWKRIAHHFGAVETLAAGPSSNSLSEATGACLFVIKNDETIATPSLDYMCLDSITRRTVLWILRTLNIFVHETRISEIDVLSAKCVFLVGTWAGPVFIEEILHDISTPSIPKEILTANNGKNFFQYILDNLHPTSYMFPTSGEHYDFFRKVERIYWDIVRCNFSALPSEFVIPENWHTLIPPSAPKEPVIDPEDIKDWP
ncbi:MAG: aminotransferase class IV [Patescibacteria group bacterium]|jgi:branched-chain amino acid aminotransferase